MFKSIVAVYEKIAIKKKIKKKEKEKEENLKSVKFLLFRVHNENLIYFMIAVIVKFAACA